MSYVRVGDYKTMGRDPRYSVVNRHPLQPDTPNELLPGEPVNAWTEESIPESPKINTVPQPPLRPLPPFLKKPAATATTAVTAMPTQTVTRGSGTFPYTSTSSTAFTLSSSSLTPLEPYVPPRLTPNTALSSSDNHIPGAYDLQTTVPLSLHPGVKASRYGQPPQTPIYQSVPYQPRIEPR